jgi:hypothetical protein
MYNLFLDTDPNINLSGSRTYVVNSAYSTATTIAPNTPAKYYSNGALRATGLTGFDEVSMNSGSLFFNGTNQYLTGGAGSTSLYLDGDFTIEFWIYGSGGGFYRYMFSKLAAYTAANNISIAFRNGNSSNISIFRGSAGGSGVIFDGGPGVTDGVWYHIAVVRSTASSLYKVFINGIGYNWLLNDTGVWDYSTFTIMANPSDGGVTLAQTATGGYLSNLRVIKGTALYTANFTPPKSSILEAVPNTSLLLQCANSTSATVDSSPNKFTVTNNGNVGYSPSGIGYLNSNLGSILFNGSNQYLSTSQILSTADDATIEAWVYLTAAPPANDAYVAAQYVSLGANRTVFTIKGTNIRMQFGATQVTGTITINQNAWYHLAWVRSGNGTNNWKQYVNGIYDGQLTYTGTYQTTPFTIGASNNIASSYFPGYISNLRVIVGTALYTADFTPPTRLLQPITNTQLLLQVANSAAYITDSSSNALTVTNVNGATYSPFTPVASVGEMQKIYSDGTISVANYFDEIIPSLQVSTLIIAGGGGGSAGSALVGGGGGGAGGLISTSANLNSGTWTVTVGQGGAAGVGGLSSGANGTNTVLTSGATTYTAIGGGAGSGNTTRYDGGSGGGIPGGSGTPGQALQPSSSSGGLGYNGSLGSGNYGVSPCDAGGGGGAGGTGSNITAGIGYSNAISGSAVTYSAGGAGGAAYGTNNGSAGATYGSGGGGGGGQGYAGAAGANGAIIISYAGSQKATGGTVTTVGANTVHTFTANGTFTY